MVTLATAKREEKLRGALAEAQRSHSDQRAADQTLWHQHQALSQRATELEEAASKYSMELRVCRERAQQAEHRAEEATARYRHLQDEKGLLEQTLAQLQDAHSAAVAAVNEILSAVGNPLASDAADPQQNLEALLASLAARVTALKAAEDANRRLDAQCRAFKVGRAMLKPVACVLLFPAPRSSLLFSFFVALILRRGRISRPPSWCKWNRRSAS